MKAAINTLEAPDPESRSPEMEGRRIIPVDEHRAWGWQIVNYSKYRAIRNDDDRREQNRLAQQKWREKQKISDVSRVSQGKPMQRQEAYTEEEKNKKEYVQQIFEFWQVTLNHPHSKLTNDRKARIKARIKEGYTVEQIKTAINGCKSSPYHMGENDHGKVYDDIELICRNGSKLEQFVGYGSTNAKQNGQPRQGGKGYDPKKDIMSPEWDEPPARLDYESAINSFWDGPYDDGTRESYERSKASWLTGKSAKGFEHEIDEYEQRSYKFRQRFGKKG